MLSNYEVNLNVNKTDEYPQKVVYVHISYLNYSLLLIPLDVSTWIWPDIYQILLVTIDTSYEIFYFRTTLIHVKGELLQVSLLIFGTFLLERIDQI